MSHQIVGLDTSVKPVMYPRPPVAGARRTYEAFARPLRGLGGMAVGLAKIGVTLAIPVGLLVLALK